MEKSAKAFRTIGEVATWLNTEAYVLRFWESRFSQIKPTKRKDGRRYYRPEDMKVVGGIKTLLHGDGLTIKGVQKILKEKGVNYVASLSPPIDIIQTQIETDNFEEESNDLQNTELAYLENEPADNRSSQDEKNVEAVDYTSDVPKNTNKQVTLQNIAKRLKSLRDRIQEENANSFNI